MISVIVILIWNLAFLLALSYKQHSVLYSFHNYFVKQWHDIGFHGHTIIYLVMHLFLYLVIIWCESLEIALELS